jgi:hypothetical protein
VTVTLDGDPIGREVAFVAEMMRSRSRRLIECSVEELDYLDDAAEVLRARIADDAIRRAHVAFLERFDPDH